MEHRTQNPVNGLYKDLLPKCETGACYVGMLASPLTARCWQTDPYPPSPPQELADSVRTLRSSPTDPAFLPKEQWLSGLSV